VFSDGAALADLNAITHPLIGAVVLERLAAESGSGRVVVLDVPLLSAQTVQLYRPRALVIVDTPEDVAADRLVEHRGFTPEDARARIAAQVGRADRLALIDLLPEGRGRVVSNAGDRAALEAEIDRTWEWLQALAGPGLMDTGTVPRGA
jgi:dephospho-CoA kinase